MTNKLLKIIFAAGWWLFVLYILTREFSLKYFLINQIVERWQLDKLIHFLLFGILAFLILNIYDRRQKSFDHYALYTFSFCAFYALFCEWLQRFIPTRTPNIWDLFAGMLGAAFFIYLNYLKTESRKPKLLLHICCVGCGIYAADILKDKFRVALYFYNPNIFPEAEFQKRLQEARRISAMLSLKLICEEYDHVRWSERVKGYEVEPEKGKRCLICYEDRLTQTAHKAHSLRYDYFSTTLTTSPHKNATAINEIGEEVGRRFNLKFLKQDLKKNDGFKRAAALTKKLNLYRQNYCGCEFSRR